MAAVLAIGYAVFEVACSLWDIYEVNAATTGEEYDEAVIGVLIGLPAPGPGQGYIRAAKAVNRGRATAKATSRGYKTFRALKRAIGAAGKGRAWHHIVEQTPSNIKRFGAEKIHNIGNVISLPHGKGSIHQKISNFYSSKQPFSKVRGKLVTVREWLSTQSFEKQREFGLEVIQRFTGGQ